MVIGEGMDLLGKLDKSKRAGRSEVFPECQIRTACRTTKHKDLGTCKCLVARSCQFVIHIWEGLSATLRHYGRRSGGEKFSKRLVSANFVALG
jgi:hypothetical protein